MTEFSTRAKIVFRRTYSRPKDDGSFETFLDVLERVIGHQRWLWERAQNAPLSTLQEEELTELLALMEQRKVLVSGRTLWLGGTEVAKRREASQFNCSHVKVETVHDVVDVLWLLLQGCGVGFTPVYGTLSGFTRPIPQIDVVRSTRKAGGGRTTNLETVKDGVWTIKVGDSAEAWAKSIGKLVAGKHIVDKLVLDFSEIRPAGSRLKGYGWISSGDEQIQAAFQAIAAVLNRRAGQLLSKLDIHDILNWLGTVLSSRRSAEISLMEYGSPEWKEFAAAKKGDYWVDNPQRAQSNNSLVFYSRPSEEELREVFTIMLDGGGSEPGFINGVEARRRAPWFSGVNPCAEILLGNRSFCNLVEVDVAKFKGNQSGLERALHIAARANYRQTLVNLEDGILQSSWHQNNQYLRLCGVGLTGIVSRPDLGAYEYKQLRYAAVCGARSMASELGYPLPKNVTTIKPSGTLSKVMDTREGVHKPLGKYIFNNINFSKHETIVPVLREAGYRVIPNPLDHTGVLVTFPVVAEDVEFETVNGLEVNLESAVSQLNRYKLLMDNYTDQNCSITVSYDPSEVPEIVAWLLVNWDSYVGVSFLLRADPTKTAQDLGFLYLPQEVVTKQTYDEYTARLRPVDISHAQTVDNLDDDCLGGVCPVR